jgi:hypothetical protein
MYSGRIAHAAAEDAAADMVVLRGRASQARWGISAKTKKEK